MTPNEYLQKILKQQSLSNDSPEIKAIRKEKEIVEEILRKEFSESNPTIRYGGSKAKGTMIKESYDLDIVCYFKHDDKNAGDTLKEIYANMKQALEDKYYVEPKTSALRLKGKDTDNFQQDFHIDVVPGRFVNDKNYDVFLYQSIGDKEYLKTNIEKHITHISDSGLHNVIKLIKYWKIRWGIFGLKTFVLELLVIKVLESINNERLDELLTKFWQELKDNVNNIKVEDPANPIGNDLSTHFGTSIKNQLSSISRGALDQIDNDNWESIFGPIQDKDEYNNIAITTAISSQKRNSAKPWSY
ncbi:MAG: hypothetical protein GF353_00645 [Candidatus Lokiarchaeota archaeon]|nr:hypothetical protein [Candidatus Lokiarchaeota archaeon]